MKKNFFIISDIVLLGVIIIEIVLLFHPNFKPRSFIKKIVSRKVIRETSENSSCEKIPVISVKEKWNISAQTDVFTVSDNKEKILFLSDNESLLLDKTRIKKIPGFSEEPSYACYNKDFFVIDKQKNLYLLEKKGFKHLYKIPEFRQSSGFSLEDLDADKRPEFIGVDSLNRVFVAGGKDGSIQWYFSDSPDTILCAPVALKLTKNKKIIITVAQNGQIIALDSSSGWVLWKNSIQSKISLKPAVFDLFGDKNEELIVSGQDKKIFCLTSEGQIIWNSSLPSTYEEVIFYDVNSDGKKEIILYSQNGSLICLCSTGSVLWTLFQKETIKGRIQIFNVKKTSQSMIVFVDNRQILHFVESLTGKEKISFELPVMPLTGIFVVNESIFFVGTDKKIYCVDTKIQ